MSHEQLIKSFAEGKVKNRFMTISQALREFIDHEAPIIEEVQVRLEVYRNKPVGALFRKNVEEYIRSDADAARKELTLYNRTFGRIDHHLAMISSNYTLLNFLEENGVSAAELNDFQAELRNYWDATYGKLVKKFSRIRDDMKKIRAILEQEVLLLEAMEKTSYFYGFDTQQEAIRLFQIERELFWKIVDEAKITKEDLKIVRDLFATQKSKTKEQIRSYLYFQKKGFTNEYEQAKNRTEKSLILLSYLLGAVNTYFSLKKYLFLWGGKGILRVFKRKDDKSLESKALGDKIATASSNLSGIELEGLLKVI
ncbi:hypothetical protein COY27_06170 [Candidatus Woesearchaeota archaeon CG_4_10_14_0_2_um_filter_33_13]|nr:MAG: hypothetical protein COY27_06170 [Candidatus Woesearchaeota archaeon CG_4_10_14_0_2_um_filter_33_13]